MFDIVTDFEKKVAEYYGAPYAVATDSCTHGLELCIRHQGVTRITVPTRTYLSVSMLPNKIFFDVPGIDGCSCNECPHMRRNTLEKLLL